MLHIVILIAAYDTHFCTYPSVEVTQWLKESSYDSTYCTDLNVDSFTTELFACIDTPIPMTRKSFVTTK